MNESVRAVIVKQGHILVEWYQPKQICFLPGGTVEIGESLEATLNRELKEELCRSDLKIGKYLGKILHCWTQEDGTREVLQHFFEVDWPDVVESAEEVLGEAGRCFKWISLHNPLLEKLAPPSLLKLILAPRSAKLWDETDQDK